MNLSTRGAQKVTELSEMSAVNCGKLASACPIERDHSQLLCWNEVPMLPDLIIQEKPEIRATLAINSKIPKRKDTIYNKSIDYLEIS